MGLIFEILALPLAPLRGTVAVANQIFEQAQQEFFDPARIQEQLQEIDRQRAAGLLSEDEATAWEDDLIERLMAGRYRTTRE
jgi:chorismate mutase